MLRGEIEEPARRDVIDAQQVRVEFAGERKVAPGLFRGREAFAGGIRRERAVGNAFQIEFLGASTKEFSIHPDPGTVGKQISHDAQT